MWEVVDLAPPVPHTLEPMTSSSSHARSSVGRASARRVFGRASVLALFALAVTGVLACSSDSGGGNDEGGGSASSACNKGPCGALVGNVLRVAATKPSAGGKGNVYVAVFDGNPILDPDNAVAVGRAIVENVDMTADDAKVAYRVDKLPVRDAPYQVVAFLDDNNNATSGERPGPDKGDLVSLQIDPEFSGVKAIVSSASDVKLDIPLNAALP